MNDVILTGTIFAISAGMIYWGVKVSQATTPPDFKKTLLLMGIGFGLVLWGAERFFGIHFFQTRDAKYNKE